jgi:hypothetical protein
MRMETNALNAARDINPRAGSQTSLNMQDAGAGFGVAQDIFQVARSPVAGFIGVIANRVKSRGFSDQEAEAIVQAAIDPTRTQEIIAYLSQRMSRREARNLVRSVAHQASVMTTSTPQ